MKTATTILVLLSLACSASAAEFRPAVAYDPAGKLDKSFNQAVYNNGVTKFRDDKGIIVKEYAPSSDSERERGIDSLAQRGFSPIVMVGFSYNEALTKVAPRYPNIDFVIIDSVVNQPNVKSLVFAEHEGSFVVGALAAMKSKSNTVGFIGGMDIPFIRKFGCGFAQGASYVNPKVNVLVDMSGTTPAAFSDPLLGQEIAESQISRGADVLYAAAGSTGIGVYQAASEQGTYAIGVDSNQNDLKPGTMLTSMVKRVGYTTYKVFEEYQSGKFEAGIQLNGLANGGVTWALDRYNRKMVSADDEARANAIVQKIIAGEIDVHDYTTNNSCGTEVIAPTVPLVPADSEAALLEDEPEA